MVTAKAHGVFMAIQEADARSEVGELGLVQRVFDNNSF